MVSSLFPSPATAAGSFGAAALHSVLRQVREHIEQSTNLIDIRDSVLIVPHCHRWLPGAAALHHGLGQVRESIEQGRQIIGTRDGVLIVCLPCHCCWHLAVAALHHVLRPIRESTEQGTHIVDVGDVVLIVPQPCHCCWLLGELLDLGRLSGGRQPRDRGQHTGTHRRQHGRSGEAHAGHLRCQGQLEREPLCWEKQRGDGVRAGQAEPAGDYLEGRSPRRSGSCCCTCHGCGSVLVGWGPAAPSLGFHPNVPPVLAASAASQGFGLPDTATAPHNAFLPC
ncbi:uncharacterized protein LOC115617885 [Strigops habroptila]|uniref:uncharacterized protein LOC115617885 n=1 Tax=Strigops habroptila TaxID=2489341 RepID=UPI0011CF0B97|nr:uncharacterized protein LOC115617885 [Strigops habroptila]